MRVSGSGVSCYASPADHAAAQVADPYGRALLTLSGHAHPLSANSRRSRGYLDIPFFALGDVQGAPGTYLKPYRAARSKLSASSRSLLLIETLVSNSRA
jgi:hypothetical protein